MDMTDDDINDVLDAEFQAQEEERAYTIWVTEDGRELPIKSMHTQHLQRALRRVEWHLHVGKPANPILEASRDGLRAALAQRNVAPLLPFESESHMRAHRQVSYLWQTLPKLSRRAVVWSACVAALKGEKPVLATDTAGLAARCLEACTALHACASTLSQPARAELWSALHEFATHHNLSTEGL